MLVNSLLEVLVQRKIYLKIKIEVFTGEHQSFPCNINKKVNSKDSKVISQYFKAKAGA